MLIPTNALAEDVSGQYVFVVEGQRAVRRAVTTAAAGGSKVRVIRGLAGGEKIVQGLSSEMQVSLQSGAGLNILN